MYRAPAGDSFKYVCGLYYQTHAQCCEHNTVEGLQAVRFVLSCMRQRLATPRLLEKLNRRMAEIADAEQRRDSSVDAHAQVKTALAELDRQIAVAAKNLALAETEAQHQAIAQVFDELQLRRPALAAAAEASKQNTGRTIDLSAAVDSAMAVLHGLVELKVDPSNLAEAGKQFKQVNARLFLRFREDLWGKRRLRKPAGGVVTWGAAPAPIDLYAGPTTRRLIKTAVAASATPYGDTLSPLVSKESPGQEGDSLGNVSRGDKI
jgi:hypothetical protein